MILIGRFIIFLLQIFGCRDRYLRRVDFLVGEVLYIIGASHKLYHEYLHNHNIPKNEARYINNVQQLMGLRRITFVMLPILPLLPRFDICIFYALSEANDFVEKPYSYTPWRYKPALGLSMPTAIDSYGVLDVTS